MTSTSQDQPSDTRAYRKAFFREEALQARRAYSGNQFAPRRRKAVIFSLLFLTFCITMSIVILALPTLQI